MSEHGGSQHGGSVLCARGLHKRFVLERNALGRPQRTLDAVRGVDLDIDRGETLAVVGESGAGKSTVGRLVLRLIEPDAGTITILGTDVGHRGRRNMRRLRSKANMIFQDPYKSLNPKLSIRYSLIEPLLNVRDRGDRRARLGRAGDLLERVGLQSYHLDRFPYEMSGGQLQRVAIARALITDPELIVCDEPVAALDMSIRAQVINLLGQIQRERGLAYLFISHDLTLVRLIADRVIVMRNGEIVEAGHTSQVYDDPQHEYTKQLLAAVPARHPSERRFRAERV